MHNFNKSLPSSEKSFWQFQEAKSKLSEVLNRVDQEGEQIIIRHKNKHYIILSEEKYQSYVSSQGSLIDIFLKFPHPDIELEIERSKETLRDIDL